VPSRDLTELGVEVCTGSLVTRIERDAVYVGDQRIACRTVFWAAGNAASSLGQSLRAPLDRAGRVMVEPDLSVPGRPEIFVASNQEGRAAAQNILRTVRSEPREPFRYHDKGSLATIGRHRAVAQFGKVGSARSSPGSAANGGGRRAALERTAQRPVPERDAGESTHRRAGP